jgi:DNA polymerase-3 subunit epsilon
LFKVYVNLIDQKEPTLNFQNEDQKTTNKININTAYYKKIITPTIEEKKKHSYYLKNNLKKNFF